MTTTPETLDSYLSGRWQRGEGIETTLVDPVTGDELATVSAKGLDLKGALEFARREGQLGLRSLSYAERGKLVGAVADVLVTNRARYEAIAIANSGNTKTDAAIDIDGGIGTLKYYARLGAGLGDARALIDDKPARLAKAEKGHCGSPITTAVSSRRTYPEIAWGRSGVGPARRRRRRAPLDAA